MEDRPHEPKSTGSAPAARAVQISNRTEPPQPTPMELLAPPMKQVWFLSSTDVDGTRIRRLSIKGALFESLQDKNSDKK